MKKIYIIFSYTGTYFSTFLRMMSGEKYIHVSISLDDKLKNVYSFGRKNPKWMFPSGFVMEDMKLITSFFEGATCQIYELPVRLVDLVHLRRELKKYIDHQNEYHYNLKGLVHIKFNRIYHRDHNFVCSQFVDKILQDSGIYDFHCDYSVIRPKNIMSIPNLKLIYEGKIINYLGALANEKES